MFLGGLAEWHALGNDLEGTDADELEQPHPRLELENKTYSLVPADSVMCWTGRNNNGGHSGTLRLSEGELDATGDLAGSFTIDMTSIRNTNLEGDDLQPVLEAILIRMISFLPPCFRKHGSRQHGFDL